MTEYTSSQGGGDDGVVVCVAGAVPKRMSTGASGFDVTAALDDGALYLLPGITYRVPTGVRVQIPHGYEAQVRARSGFSSRTGVIMPNVPGTIDSDFRGEILIPMLNTSDRICILYSGDRIAQLVFMKVCIPEIRGVAALQASERGTGGFGSTGG